MPLVRLTAWLLLVTLATTAFAHQQKESITRVLFNPRTGNIEVMHRFIIHDAEHAMSELFGKSADLLGSQADRDQFADYVYARFSLTDQNGQSIALAPVGNEVEGKHLWVYAEAPVPENVTELTVAHSALRDLWRDQSNLVNIERDGEIRTAVFAGGSSEITLAL